MILYYILWPQKFTEALLVTSFVFPSMIPVCWKWVHDSVGSTYERRIAWKRFLLGIWGSFFLFKKGISFWVIRNFSRKWAWLTKFFGDLYLSLHSRKLNRLKVLSRIKLQAGGKDFQGNNKLYLEFSMFYETLETK